MPTLVTQISWPRRAALEPLATSPTLWCLLATGYVIVCSIGLGLGALPDRLGDTDDAVRLLAVRELMAGAPWFDTTLPRIGAPEPLLSHWSRLIDLGLAGMLVLFRPLLGTEGAELATRIMWPALLFFSLLRILVREAHRRAGPWAGLFVIILAVTSSSVVVQFNPGRVDHHNAQILCAIAGVLFLARSLEEPRCGVIAGLLFGAGLAVGYEALVLVVPALAIAALIALWRPALGRGVVLAAAAASATMLALLVLTMPPGRWLDIRCDALALNLPILAAFCTAGLWAALSFAEHAGFAARCGVVGVSAAAGAAVYVLLEPACLAGPMGQLNPALNAIWLDAVMEGNSVLWLIARHPAAGLSFLAFVLAGAAAQIAIWCQRKDAVTGLATVIVLLAVLLGCWQIRLMSYASWMAILPIAVWCAGWGGRALASPAHATVIVALVSQTALGMVLEAGAASVRWVAGSATAAASADVEPCYLSSNVRRLGALAPGLVAADIDLGAFVVATTHHRVVAAPYHRLDKGIIANQAILEGAPLRAQQQMQALGVGYVALCAVPGQRTAPGSLRARLLANEPVPFLRELDVHPAKTIRVWRVAPAG